MRKHFYKKYIGWTLSIAAGCAFLSMANLDTFAKEPSPIPEPIIAQKNDAAPQIPAGTRIWKNTPYITNGHERNILDLLVPPSDKPLPLIVWVHGGAWVGGDKGEGALLLRYLQQGYAIAAINYRFSQHAIFPAQLEDCKAAIRWLRSNADATGIDPKRIGVGGGSAGGHLVALLGSTGQEKKYDVGEYTDVSSEVQAVCDFFGPADFEHFEFDAVSNNPGRDDPKNPFWLLVGGHPNTLKNDAEALKKLNENLRDVSPVTHVMKNHPPTVILHGNKDDIVPLSQSELYLKALKEKEVESALYVVDGCGHGFLGENIWRIMDTFFERHLKPEKASIGYREQLSHP